jgi:hypothetical protein
MQRKTLSEAESIILLYRGGLMIVQFRKGLLRIVQEPQFCLDTSSPLLTLQVSDFPTLCDLELDELGDMRLDPSNTLFPFTIQAYPEQMPGDVLGGKANACELLVGEDFTPAPKAFRWIRWFEHRPGLDFGNQWGKYMVGHCFPEEVNKTRWLHCLAEDQFFAYPLTTFPKDFDDIWIYEDEDTDSEESM